MFEFRIDIISGYFQPPWKSFNAPIMISINFVFWLGVGSKVSSGLVIISKFPPLNNSVITNAEDI